MFQETGQNGIGVFNFSYHVLNLANKYEESFTQVQYPPLDNCTCDSESMIIESTTSPWSWIAVSILFMLLTALFVIVSSVLACIVKQKSNALKLTKNQHGTTRPCTCTSGMCTNHNHTRNFHGHIDPALFGVHNLNSIAHDRDALKMLSHVQWIEMHYCQTF